MSNAIVDATKSISKSPKKVKSLIDSAKKAGLIGAGAYGTYKVVEAKNENEDVLEKERREYGARFK